MKLAYRPDIDALRAFAVLAVVIFQFGRSRDHDEDRKSANVSADLKGRQMEVVTALRFTRRSGIENGTEGCAC